MAETCRRASARVMGFTLPESSSRIRLAIRHAEFWPSLPENALFLQSASHSDNVGVVNTQERNGRSTNRSTRF